MERSTIGTRIRKLRLERSMTQRTLAERAGVSEATVIGRLERGEHVPRLDTAAAIATALEVPLGALIGSEEEGATPPASLPLRRTAAERRFTVLGSKLSDTQLVHVLALLEDLVGSHPAAVPATTPTAEDAPHPASE